jgi:hypothetical protein
MIVDEIDHTNPSGKAQYYRPSNVTEKASAGHYVFGLASGIGHIFLPHQPNCGPLHGRDNSALPRRPLPSWLSLNVLI